MTLNSSQMSNLTFIFHLILGTLHFSILSSKSSSTFINRKDLEMIIQTIQTLLTMSKKHFKLESHLWTTSQVSCKTRTRNCESTCTSWRTNLVFSATKQAFKKYLNLCWTTQSTLTLASRTRPSRAHRARPPDSRPCSPRKASSATKGTGRRFCIPPGVPNAGRFSPWCATRWLIPSVRCEVWARRAFARCCLS